MKFTAKWVTFPGEPSKAAFTFKKEFKSAKKIKRFLKELDLNRCTPLEAFSILTDLVEQAKD